MTGVEVLVPMHAEATDDPDVVRWVVPPLVLPVDGEVITAPEALAALLEDGTLAEVRVVVGAVLVRSGGTSWRTLGGTVRSALQAALGEPNAWVLDGDVVPGDRVRAPEADALTTAVREVLDGPTGDFIRSHGGHVEVVSVADHCVEVRLSGACAHCPASVFTLHGRLEQDLRVRYPELVELRAVGAEPFLPSWLTRKAGAGVSVRVRPQRTVPAHLPQRSARPKKAAT